MTKVLACAIGVFLAAFAVAACAQDRPRPSAPQLQPLPATSLQPPLRAAPLPPGNLHSGTSKLPAAPSVYSVPYGPHFSRPSGAPTIPFGSSRYYYRR